MLGMKLVRLIERHSEVLSRGLAAQIRKSERTSDFRKIPAEDLRLAATEVYRNLGEWLLQKTEVDVAGRFKAIAARRAEEGISLHQFVWALMLTRDHLFQFLRREALADTIVELHGELELHQLLNQFFTARSTTALWDTSRPAMLLPKATCAEFRISPSLSG